VFKLTQEQIAGIDQRGTIWFSVEEKTQYVYWKWFYDKVFFGDYFLKHWKGEKNAEFHKEIHDALDKYETLWIICPRWHAKTTTILIDILHAICYKIYWSQLYIAPAGLWEEWIWKIRKELETNKLIHSVFWVLVPTQDKKTKEEFWAKKWRMKHLELLNWEAIETMTKGWNIRWRRPKRIIVDDFEENKDVLNKTIVEKARIWFFTSLFNTLLPWGKIAILWTVVWSMCMVKYVKETKNWHIIEYEACTSDFENILWTDMWSKEDLIKRRKKIWTALFNQEFRNIALSSEDAVIKDHWIRYWEHLPEFDFITMWLDPASETKEKSDFFWIWVMWFKDNKKYVLHSKGYKLSPANTKLMIKVLNSKFKPNKIYYEKNKDAYFWKILGSEENLPMELIHQHKDKMTNLLSVAWQIEFWEVYFKPGLDQENLITQLTTFPDVEHDDEMDCLVWNLLHGSWCNSNSVDIL